MSRMMHISSKNLPARFSRPGGFTLIELLVVITIIVLVSAAALPAFRFITSSRSIDSAYNVVDATLGRARQDAMISHDVRGVFIFLDPVTDRTGIAFVQAEPEPASPYDMDAYKGWDTGLPAQAYSLGARAIYPGLNNNEVGAGGGPKIIVAPFRNSANGTNAQVANATTGAPNSPWVIGSSKYLDKVPGSEVQLLPPGVGLQLVNDNGGTTAPDRYLRTGVVLFDSQGRLLVTSYAVRSSSKLGTDIRLAVDMPTAGNTLVSQLGVVFYERERFVNAQLANSGSAPTEADFTTAVCFAPGTPMGNVPTLQSETDEETWLAANANTVMVNRASGTLMFTR